MAGRRAGLRRDPVHQVRHRRRGRARARPRRDRLHPRGPAGDLRPPRRAGGDRDGAARRRTRSPSSRSTSARRRTARRRSSTPRSRTRRSARRSPTRIDRERINEIATQGTSFVAHGLLPSFYKAFYEVPEQDYPYDPELGNQMLDDAGWVLNDDGVREKDGEVLSFDLFVRSESPFADPEGEADRRADPGDRGRVQRPGGQHRQAHRAHGPQGRRQAGAGVRHLHLGLGRRPVRPELPAQPDDHGRDRRLVRRLLLEPRVRPAVRGADRPRSTPRSARR